MKHIRLFEEFTSKLSDDVDIIYRDRNLVIMIPKTPESTKKYSRDTMWCSNNKSGFYQHSVTANLFRFHFKDGYKLRLTWDYIPYDGESYSGGTHWGQGGKLDGKILSYEYIRPKNEMEPFEFDYNKDDYRQMMVDRIKTIPNEAKEKVIEYQKSRSIDKTDNINKMHKEIQTIKVTDVKEDIVYSKKNNNKSIKVNIKTIKDGVVSDSECRFYADGEPRLYIGKIDDKSGATHYHGSGILSYVYDKMIVWIKNNNMSLYNDIKNLTKNEISK